MRRVLLLFALILLVCSIPGGFSPVDNTDIPNLVQNDIYKAA